MRPKGNDIGPEPSAADVVDFLDLLPSPTRSPIRPNREASVVMRRVARAYDLKHKIGNRAQLTVIRSKLAC